VGKFQKRTSAMNGLTNDRIVGILSHLDDRAMIIMSTAIVEDCLAVEFEWRRMQFVEAARSHRRKPVLHAGAAIRRFTGCARSNTLQCAPHVPSQERPADPIRAILKRAQNVVLRPHQVLKQTHWAFHVD
jgi:hypothetical protein